MPPLYLVRVSDSIQHTTRQFIQEIHIQHTSVYTRNTHAQTYIYIYIYILTHTHKHTHIHHIVDSIITHP